MMETDQINRSTRDGVLVRPQAGRVLAGVAAAIARRLSIPTWLVRVVFVILAFSGGVGFVAYAAGWLLIPAEGDERPAAERLLGRIEGPRAWIGVGLVVLAVLVAVESTGLIDPDLALAALLILVGVLLYRGDLGLGSTEEETTDMTTETSTDLSTTSVLDTKPGDGPAEPPAAPPEPPVPAAPTPPPIPPTPRPRSILGRVTIAVGLIVLGVMGFFDTVGGYEVAARHYLGTAVMVIGLGLLIGSVAGRARGLIVLGVILTPALLISPLGDLDLSGEDVRYEPQTVSEIQTAYTADVGTMEIDLSNVDFAGADVSFDADLRLGQIIIIVPDDISVDAMASVAAGEVRVFDSVEAGLGEIGTRRQIDGENGTLEIDAEADAGQIQIWVEGEERRPRGTSFNIGGDAEILFSAATRDDLQDSYEVGVGDLELDFSDLEMTTPKRIDVGADLGSITVILPDGVDAEINAAVDLGDIELPNGSQEGVDRRSTYRSGPNPLLFIDIKVGAGSIIVEDLR